MVRSLQLLPWVLDPLRPSRSLHSGWPLWSLLPSPTSRPYRGKQLPSQDCYRAARLRYTSPARRYSWTHIHIMDGVVFVVCVGRIEIPTATSDPWVRLPPYHHGDPAGLVARHHLVVPVPLWYPWSPHRPHRPLRPCRPLRAGRTRCPCGPLNPLRPLWALSAICALSRRASAHSGLLSVGWLLVLAAVATHVSPLVVTTSLITYEVLLSHALRNVMPTGPCGPCGPATPCGPVAPVAPGSPCGPVVPRVALLAPRAPAGPAHPLALAPLWYPSRPRRL